jgi:hypothetical protein
LGIEHRTAVDPVPISLRTSDLSADLADEGSRHDWRLLLPLSKSPCLSLVDVDAGVFLAPTVVKGYLPMVMLTAAILVEWRFLSLQHRRSSSHISSNVDNGSHSSRDLPMQQVRKPAKSERPAALF